MGAARPGQQAGRRFPGTAMARSPHVVRRVTARKAQARIVPGPKAKDRGLPARMASLRNAPGRAPPRLPAAVLRALRMFRLRAARLRPSGLLPPRLRLVRAGRPCAVLPRRHVHRRVRKARLRMAACRLPIVAPSAALPRRGPR